MVFHNFMENSHMEIFNGGADNIMDRLSTSAEAVGKALNELLQELSEKVCAPDPVQSTSILIFLLQIEVNIAVLWEGIRDDPAQLHARAEVIKIVNEIVRQVGFWNSAREVRDLAAAAPPAGDVLMEY
jgi:hypothetical protein